VRWRAYGGLSIYVRPRAQYTAARAGPDRRDSRLFPTVPEVGRNGENRLAGLRGKTPRRTERSELALSPRAVTIIRTCTRARNDWFMCGRSVCNTAAFRERVRQNAWRTCKNTPFNSFRRAIFVFLFFLSARYRMVNCGCSPALGQCVCTYRIYREIFFPFCRLAPARRHPELT